MPTVFSHAVSAVALGRASMVKRPPRRFWFAAIVCACLPDADVIGFPLGIRYGDLFGHRGFSHSLLFAVVVGFAARRWVFPDEPRGTKRWWAGWALFSVITA